MLSLNNLLYWDTNKCFESIWGLSAAIGWWTHLWITALGHCSCAFFTAFLYLSCSSWMNTDTAEMEQCDQGTLIWKHSCPTGWCDVVLWKEKKPSNASCVLKCLPFSALEEESPSLSRLTDDWIISLQETTTSTSPAVLSALMSAKEQQFHSLNNLLTHKKKITTKMSG